MTPKKVIITILNGGFNEKYNDDKVLNKFLKNIEKESKMLHEYFYKIDKRINDEDMQNYKGKSFSRISQDIENPLLMYLYDYLCFKKIKMTSLVFDGIILFPKQQIDLNDAQNYIFSKSGIKMKIVIKPFKDNFQKFGISNVNIKEYKERYINKIYINNKVVHHLHYKSKNNIVDYICQNCNLKIKNKKQLVILFHNSKGYDNQYMLNIFSKIKNIRIECIGENDHQFKMLEFHIPEKNYSIRIIDSLSFLQGKLEDLGIELEDDKKIKLMKHFKNKFKYIKRKLLNFPYNYVRKDTLDEKNLPDKKEFYNILTMKHISDEEYKNVKEFYKQMKFKNIREYLSCYLETDILLLSDVFENFRNMIFEKFSLGPVKYISSLGLTKDCCLKHTNAKIETIQDVSIYNFVKNSVQGGLSDSINPYVKLDNKNQTIGYIDINSMYPHSLRKKIPVGQYKFIDVDKFDVVKYSKDSDYNCYILAEVYTTEKVKNNYLYKQCPM